MNQESTTPPQDWEVRNDEFRAVLKTYIEYFGFLRDLKYEMPVGVYEIVSRALLGTWFVVPVEAPDIALVKRIGLVRGVGDTPVLTVFTSLESARLFWGDTSPQSVIISGVSLCHLLASTAQTLANAETESGESRVPSGLVIDVSGPLPFALPLAVVVALATDEIPHQGLPE